MVEYQEIMDMLFNNLKKIFFPEEWLDLDLSFSKTELFMLLLADRQGEIIMSQASDYLNVPMSTATGIAERLVRNGYLRRERSESDRRIVVIRLTEKGSELVTGLKNKASEYIGEISGLLSEDEKQILIKTFLKVVEFIEEKHAGVKTGEGEKGQQIKRIEIE